jgi:hypothetical protein
VVPTTVSSEAADLDAVCSARVSTPREAMAARAKLPLTNQWLGFNIAAGIFGSLDDGASGHTSQGPGSNAIRAVLSSSRPGYERRAKLLSM